MQRPNFSLQALSADKTIVYNVSHLIETLTLGEAFQFLKTTVLVSAKVCGADLLWRFRGGVQGHYSSFLALACTIVTKAFPVALASVLINGPAL